MAVADQLLRLAELRDKGEITPEEFARLKSELLASETSTASPVANSSNVAMGAGGIVGLILMFLLIGWLLSMCVSNHNGASQHEATATVEEVKPSPPTWTPPEGYQMAYTDNGIPYGFRWLKGREYKCDLGDECWGAEIVLSQACSTFYAQITIMDKDGTDVGWTNETAQSVQAGHKTRLVFSSYQSGAKTARLGTTTCL